MVNVFAKDNGLGITSNALQVFGDLPRDQFGALVQHERAVHVELVVNPVVNELAVFVALAGLWLPAKYVLVEINANDFVRREEAIGDALFERVGKNRIAEVINVRSEERRVGKECRS